MKGNVGYIDDKKRKQLIRTIILFGIAAGIFILGLVLNKMSKANVFTILAVLMVLPSAKYLTNVIVLRPFKSVSIEQFKRVKEYAYDEDFLLTDMVITSPQKIMMLHFVELTSNKVVCLAEREKDDATYIEDYLRNELSKQGHKHIVKVFKDEKHFIKKLKEIKTNIEMTEEELNEMEEVKKMLLCYVI